MHQLNALLGMPQHRFASIHVVGTNGKSSVTRMCAALLEAHGVGAGACVSPHTAHWSERVLLHGKEIGGEELAAAVERVAQAAEVLNRKLAEGAGSRGERGDDPEIDRPAERDAGEPEVVTQFEVATAASFVALARAKVQVAVVEAGLGGRLDATNTIPSRVTVLTSVGLDHTEWLGQTEEEIAAEKLAVLRDGSTLVVGSVSPTVMALAERFAAERGARLVVAPQNPGAGIEVGAPGRFQRRNFAVAMAAAEAFRDRPLDPATVDRVAGSIRIPGRLERIADDPPTFVDAAHNPDGAAALAEALADLPPKRGRLLSRIAPQKATAPPVVLCLAVLAEKDTAAMARALAPAVARAVCTELPGFRADRSRTSDRAQLRSSVAAAELAHECEGAGIPAEVEPDFAAAVRRARGLAAEAGGIAVVAGSHYALAPARAVLDR